MVLTTDLTLTRSEMIKKLTQEHSHFFPSQPIFVETGSGVSTLGMAEVGREYNAKVYSCDRNQEKIDELIARTKGKLDNVEIIIGHSVDILEEICKKHGEIHFAHLDSGGSAMLTFNEFMAIQDYLQPGACLLIDNAALPEEKDVLTEVRKGKILVPYLLASSHWDVQAHPKAGGSMVSATLHEEGNFAEFDYEYPEYVDDWRNYFAENLGT
jgi:predicted O-methyltransferase YrrM